jgi:hypothetical protein
MDLALRLPLWAYVLIAGLTVLSVVMGLRGQRLNLGRLWVVPATLIVLTALAFSLEPARPAPVLALDGSALAAGAALGWWRGQFIQISLDPQTYALRSYTSPVGMLALLAVVLARLVFRAWFIEHADALHLSVNEATEAFLVLALGFVCAERIELGLRALRKVRHAKLEALTRKIAPVPTRGL